MYVRIKEIRKRYGDTLQSLAKKVDYDYSNLSKVERGIYEPSLELLYKIAMNYNIDITELLVNSVPAKTIELENNGEWITVDGQKISKEELFFLIQSIRIFRQSIQK